jgi:hypothetical protein
MMAHPMPDIEFLEPGAEVYRFTFGWIAVPWPGPTPT